jgi:hypothetical protein
MSLIIYWFPACHLSCIHSVNNSNRAPAVFRDVTTRSPASSNTYPYDTAGNSETSLNFHQTTRRHIAKDNHLYDFCRKIIKSHN